MAYPTPRVSSDGTGRDSYIVRDKTSLRGSRGRDSNDGAWALRRGNMVDTLKAHHAQVAAAYNAGYIALCKAQADQLNSCPRQPVIGDAPKRGKRPVGRRTVLRKSWVPMGGAPRKLLCSPKSAGPPQAPARAKSMTREGETSVRVELERALWLGRSLPPPGMPAMKEPAPKPIRGAAIVRPVSAHPTSAVCSTPEDSKASTPKPKQRPKSAVVSGRPQVEPPTAVSKPKARPKSAVVGGSKAHVPAAEDSDDSEPGAGLSLTTPQARRQRPISAPSGARPRAARPVSAFVPAAGKRSVEEHIHKTDL
mmetsp:Transcript_82632/g.145783  ORF Transcript_82632/g.145783 Transcript_82632/m.145783 type:complete len:308 (+) Transcript_82632:48-971(+)